jgi:hypothetical protein
MGHLQRSSFDGRPSGRAGRSRLLEVYGFVYVEAPVESSAAVAAESLLVGRLPERQTPIFIA